MRTCPRGPCPLLPIGQRKIGGAALAIALFLAVQAGIAPDGYGQVRDPPLEPKPPMR